MFVYASLPLKGKPKMNIELRDIMEMEISNYMARFLPLFLEFKNSMIWGEYVSIRLSSSER
jgi:hypothetical protein